jgi:tetratricopeptide (TPR) repeat protein
MCSGLLLLLLAAPAAAADRKRQAREDFREATRFYEVADFEHALAKFKSAYLLHDDPALLFNIAQSYRQLGNKPEAIRFYKTYLHKVPAAANADEVRRLLATLEAPPPVPPAPEPVKRVETPPPLITTPPVVAPAANDSATTLARPAPPRRQPLYKKWWLWTAVGVVVAGAAVGAAVGVTSSGASEPTFPVVHAP